MFCRCQQLYSHILFETMEMSFDFRFWYSKFNEIILQILSSSKFAFLNVHRGK